MNPPSPGAGPPHHPAHRGARAFALPLVILLTLVVSLAVAVLMQRNGVGYLAARRQADGYIRHHAGLGMREMVSRWLTTVRGRLKESIEDDGFAFRLDLPDGQKVDVFLDDAQGTALSRADALTGRRREIVELMNAYLDLVEQQRAAADAARAVPGAAPRPAAHTKTVKGTRTARARGNAPGASSQTTDPDLPLRRNYGPSEISIKTASREVLEALASAITDPKKAADIADAIIKKREDQSGTRDLGVEEVTRTLRERGLDDEELHEIGAMLVYVPTLFRVTAELTDASGRLIDKAQGLMEVKEGETKDPYNQNGPFLTWESVPLEDE